MYGIHEKTVTWSASEGLKRNDGIMAPPTSKRSIANSGQKRRQEKQAVPSDSVNPIFGSRLQTYYTG